ncbi:MAG: hypothetical protein NTV87_12110 [Ignavibacteriae bacterium]|nr:hypothetical protein [Ignavibacteriota bacterium]
MEHLSKIYLDTSVINFLYADDSPELKEITIDLFENYIGKNFYKTYISDFVLFEIGKTKDPSKKEKLLKIIEDYKIELLYNDNKDEIIQLGKIYLERGVIPKSSEIDAYHVAYCVICNINYLVSWNYKHLANINKERTIKLINIEHNYINELRIITPLELLSNE